ncbi:MAG: hypothetical protein ABI577_06555 [bacterium]
MDHNDRHSHAEDKATPTDGGLYTLQLEGHLSPRWAALFPGMTLEFAGDAVTILEGFIEDQAALHALFRTLRDTGLEIISVVRAPPR